MNSRFLEALKGQNRGDPPIWLMRQAGRYMPSYRALRARYSFLELCHEPELIEKVTLLPVAELGVDAAILFSDILMVPEALGFEISFDESGPIIHNPLSSPFDIDLISELSPDRISYLSEAITSLKKRLKIPLIGFAGAPFTLATYLIEGKTNKTLKKTKAFFNRDKESFLQLIAKLENAVTESLLLQIRAGCDVVQLFDTWAGELSEEDFHLYSLAPLKKIQERIKATKKPLIYFCRGSSYRAPLIAKTGVSAISIDHHRPIFSVRREVKTIPLQGNLPPEALYQPKESLKKTVDQLLQSMRGDPAYIFNLGHGILPDVPYENVQFLVAHLTQKR